MKPTAIFLLALVLLPLLSGCWDTIPLEDRGIILGIGISPGRDGQLSYTFAIPSALVSPPGGGSTPPLEKNFPPSPSRVTPSPRP